VFERIREIKARTGPEGEIVDEEHRIASVDIEVEE